MKIVINKNPGGFINLSEEAKEWLIKHYGNSCVVYRDSPELINCIEELGSEIASGPSSKLKIVEVPDNVRCHIENCDGKEWIAEDYRIWA